MNRISLAALVLLSALALAGCGSGGGGDDEIIDSRTNEPVAFVDWGSNPAGETVKDVEMEDYKFTAADPAVPSCLYDVESKTVILSFCQAPGQVSSRYLFVGRYIDVKLVKLPDGSCGAAMVDAELGGIVHVYVQNGGVTVLAEPDPAITC